jgi:hypothetical protein
LVPSADNAARLDLSGRAGRSETGGRRRERRLGLGRGRGSGRRLGGALCGDIGRVRGLRRARHLLQLGKPVRERGRTRLGGPRQGVQESGTGIDLHAAVL